MAIMLIQDLIEKAKRKGESVHKRNNTEVYKAEFEENTFKLFHYGSKILTIENKKAYIGKDAYSMSDLKAINTALFEFDLHNKYKATMQDGDFKLETL